MVDHSDNRKVHEQTVDHDANVLLGVVLEFSVGDVRIEAMPLPGRPHSLLTTRTRRTSPLSLRRLGMGWADFHTTRGSEATNGEGQALTWMLSAFVTAKMTPHTHARTFLNCREVNQ